jgi:hypothetical protein
MGNLATFAPLIFNLSAAIAQIIDRARETVLCLLELLSITGQ